MKKTLIASAVAAATLSTTAFAMDPATQLAERLDSMPEFYGNIQLYWESETTDTTAGEDSVNEFKNGGSTLGVKHQHAITEDLTGFLKAEFEFAADDKSASTGLSKLDEAYIGVKGGFGSVQVGSDDTVYDWIDMIDTSEQIGLGGGIDASDQGDNLQYYSPEIADGLTIGVTLPIDSDNTFGGAIAAKYDIDNLSVALAYSMGREEGDPLTTGDADGDTIGLGLSFTVEDLTLIAQYETKDESYSNADDGGDFWGLQGMYGMGANTFALGYGVGSADGTPATGMTDETSKLYLQALHNVSDHMYVYLEYAMESDADFEDNKDVDTLAIGATYAF